MRKHLLFLLAIIAGGVSATGRTIWTGATSIDWGNSFIQISNTQVGTVHAGDKVVLTYQVTKPDDQWPQYRICDGSWNILEFSNVKNGMTQSTAYLSPAGATAINSTGMVITGSGITVTQIDIEDGDHTADYSHAVWLGEGVIGNWNGFSVAASVFSTAQVGQKLRIKFKNPGIGATLSPRDPEGWVQLPGAENVTLAGVKHDYTITADMLTVLQSRGLIVGGVNFTCTAIELWNSDELKPLNLNVPVTNGWVFEDDTTPSFKINIANPYQETINAKVMLSIATDKMTPHTEQGLAFDVAANKSQDITLSLENQLDPGIYHATIMVNDDLARGFFFAVNPKNIVSSPDKQSDFDNYWQAALTQLEAVDINATKTEITSRSGSKRKVYLVEMQSIADGLSGDPVTIRGYYAEPTDGKKHPVIIHYQGYDSGYRPGGDSTTPWCMYGDSGETDYAEFILSNRGQSVNNRKASERVDGITKDFTNIYGDWFAYEFGNKDSYYYRGAYMDCVRAIDFMAAQATSDMDNLFAEGQSQGGAFTVAAAALSKGKYTFKAIAPAITFMGDFSDYFQLATWPAGVAEAQAKEKGMTNDEMLAFMSYYDTKNLAPNISCPYITSVGLQDNVCPPHTNLAPYSNVKTPEADKQVIFNAELMHATNSQWSTTYMNFFRKYQTTTGIKLIEDEVKRGERCECYNLNGQRVDTLGKGLYIIDKKKVVIR